MPKNTPKSDGQPTEYVVLKQALAGEDGEAWVVVGRYQARSKTSAIRKHTGDGADVLEGVWKACPASSWRGGEVTKRVTAAERVALVDE